MISQDFADLITENLQPTILVEGTRNLPAHDTRILTRFASDLARSFPRLRFRTGNATGSDQAFAQGVAEVDAARLEYVAPYARHRLRDRHPGSSALALDALSTEQLHELAHLTGAATPKLKDLAQRYVEGRVPPRQASSAQLLLRDTLKVTGTETFDRPVAGIFYVNPEKPDGGGTGHTIRVCRNAGIPVFTQAEWRRWQSA